jgi:hypothetical protein
MIDKIAVLMLIVLFIVNLNGVIAQEVYTSEVLWNGKVSEVEGIASQLDRNTGVVTSFRKCKFGLCYFRTDNPLSFIEIGDLGKNENSRGNIDWDISGLPLDIDVIDIEMRIFLENVPEDIELRVMQMLGGSAQYPNNPTDCGGNCQFYNDMADGEVYDSQIYPAGGEYQVIIDLDANNDLQNYLGLGVFSTGLSPEIGRKIVIGSKDNSDEIKRPELVITYNVFANETDGVDATESGILNSLSEPRIFDDQLVNLVKTDGTQTIGKFDKFAKFGSQRWAFNYISYGEEFNGMENVSNRFFVSEFEDLNVEEIMDHVEEFIEETAD